MSLPVKRVLDVGQCGPDHASIRRLLESRFAAVVDRAHYVTDAMEALQTNAYDLVLVNRLFDADGYEGIELIRRLKTDPNTRDVPVMLVSNHDDAQTAAEEAGALRGFGKAQLRHAATIERLAAVLA